MLFDGREFAERVLASLPKDTGKKLAVILDPDNPASVAYTNLKAKVAGRLGVDFVQFPITNNQETNKIQVTNFNKKRDVDGIVIQMPCPGSEELIPLIDPKKDVDGLREDSLFKPAAVRAVNEILTSPLLFPSPKFRRGVRGEVLVVGSHGFVGKRLIRELPGAVGMDKDDFPTPLGRAELRRADVIISATGQVGLIKSEMVKSGVVCIDVGYPKGDFDPGVGQKASFFTPVPGGVGPVTVAMLFKNLLQEYI